MALDLLKSIPLPTVDRPFGVELWPIFAKAYSAVVGSSPTDFRFVEGVTPLSTLKETATMLVSYYVITFGGRELMKGRQAFSVNGAFIVHNFYLTVISAVLLALFIEQLLGTLVREGVFFAICNEKGGWTKEMVTLYYLNYLTKYLELLDTVFLVLKKKPLTFLHTYHHGATALLCYTQLLGCTAVSWVPITLNLTVHVVMYWYYFQSARGIRIWWKKYITMLQILQFVIDLGFVYFASYTYFSSVYFPWAPNMGRCAGEEFAAFAGIGILSSYLLLFISFYFATYKKEKKEGKRSRPRRSTSTSAAIAMKDFQVPGLGGNPPVAVFESDPNENGAASSGPSTGGPTRRSRKA